LVDLASMRGKVGGTHKSSRHLKPNQLMGGMEVNEGFNSSPSRQMIKMSASEWKKNLEFFRKYHVAEDPNFNEKRNREIIDGTIKKNDALRRKHQREFRNELGEKIDMVASYLKSRAVDGGTPIEKYLGKRWMAKLRGEQIIRRLQDTLMVRDQDGRIIRKPGEII